MAINQALLKKIADTIFNTFDGISTDVTFTRVIDGGFDPATRKPITTEQDVTLVGLTTSFMKKEINGENIKSGDLQLYIKYDDFTFVPKLDDAVTIEGEDWDIVDLADIEQKKSVYWFQLRRSS